VGRSWLEWSRTSSLRRDGVTLATTTAPEPAAERPVHEHHVLIVGAGFSGIGMAARLRDMGIEDFAVLDRGNDLGGTWRDNSYPGAACDVPSNLYSFSFALNPDWSRAFPSQSEIWDYMRACVDRFEVGGHLRFGRSEGRTSLRDFFEVDSRFITIATLHELAQDGLVGEATVQNAIQDLGINTDKPNPLTS